MDLDVVFDPKYSVFPTERRIYGSDSLNHRSNPPAAVYDKLFEDISVDPDT